MKLLMCAMFQGYHGVLCGACDDTHGRVNSNGCQACGPAARDIAVAILLALWSVFLGFLMMKSALSSNDSQQPDQVSASPVQGNKTSYPSEIFKVRM